MKAPPRPAPSLRRRLVVQLLALAAVAALALYLAVRTSSERASEAALDALLGAATLAMAEGLRPVEGGAEANIDPGTFSMLAATGEERLFYRVLIGGQTVTGYDDLPLPPALRSEPTPAFYAAAYRDAQLRLAAVGRSLMIEGRATPVLVVLGQTRDGQAAIASALANRAAAVGLAIFLVAVPLSLLAAGRVLRPIEALAGAVAARGPRDLRPVRHPAPQELAPLMEALNGLIARLKFTLDQTETFLAEAAHHIRTPLATLRSEAEVAMRLAPDDALRARLQGMIRAVDESARSAGQLLDHATVLYRADRQAAAPVDLRALVQAQVERFRPTADLRDIALALEDRAPTPFVTRGDAVLIEAALRNLLDNALKYSPGDSRVTVRLSAAGKSASIAVLDRGPGLQGADPAALIARFQRGPGVGGIVGSGLGLTIVAEVAAATGGTFHLTDRDGGGACATLLLPLR
jgi:two-component system sensor histidine kinase TctE